MHGENTHVHVTDSTLPIAHNCCILKFIWKTVSVYMIRVCVQHVRMCCVCTCMCVNACECMYVCVQKV